MFSEATDCTLAAVCDEIEGGYRHNYQPDYEVRHGEAHDEHVGHRLEPLLCPDGVQDHPVPHRGQRTEQQQGQTQQ